MNETASPSTARPVAALLTPRGRGAVATIRFLGDCRLIDEAEPPLFRAANGKPLRKQPIDRIVFGRWGAAGGTVKAGVGGNPVPSRNRVSTPAAGEAVVLCRTDERTLEIHCHAGEAAAASILSSLETIGCRIKTWQRLAEQSHGTFEAECLIALTRATTRRTAEILLEQHSGVLRREIEAIRRLVLADKSVPDTAKVSRTLASVRDTRTRGSSHGEGADGQHEALRRLDVLLRWSDFGLHLSRPWSVVLAGRPNVGKSSLINALAGFARAIVHERPGTTRDVVTAEIALDGWPISLSDTAGIREEAEPLEAAGIERARRVLQQADCRVLLLDVSRPPEGEDWRLLSEWPDAVRVAHKCDLPSVWGNRTPDDALAVSSLTGKGVDSLAEELASRLVSEVPEPRTAIPVALRQVDLLIRARGELVAANIPGCAAALDECLA